MDTKVTCPRCGNIQRNTQQLAEAQATIAQLQTARAQEKAAMHALLSDLWSVTDPEAHPELCDPVEAILGGDGHAACKHWQERERLAETHAEQAREAQKVIAHLTEERDAKTQQVEALIRRLDGEIERCDKAETALAEAHAAHQGLVEKWRLQIRMNLGNQTLVECADELELLNSSPLTRQGKESA